MGATSGREKNGQFAAGNPGGPGNPYARKTAALRSAAADFATADQVRTVLAAMYLKAAGGDVAAARVWLAYSVGKPGPSADPDTLDAHELKVRRASVATADDVDAVLAGVPASDVCEAAADAAAHPSARATIRRELHRDVRHAQGQTTEVDPFDDLDEPSPIRRPPSGKSASDAGPRPVTPTAPAPVGDGGRRAPSPNGESGVHPERLEASAGPREEAAVDRTDAGTEPGGVPGRTTTGGAPPAG